MAVTQAECATEKAIMHHAEIDHELLVSGNRCVLADFGLSRMIISQAPAGSSMTMRGSVRWMAPELIGDQHNRSHLSACDVYSFGCTIIEASKAD